MADWASVADTAVKIGLGALIGGWFTIWTLRLNQRHDLVKQRLERRFNLLQEAQLEVSGFAGIMSTYWANTRNAAHIRDRDGGASEAMRQELEEEEKKVFTAFADLSTSRGKILLVGEKEACAALAQLHEACSSLFRIAHIDSEKCTVAALDEARKNIEQRRADFYDRMAEAFARGA